MVWVACFVVPALIWKLLQWVYETFKAYFTGENPPQKPDISMAGCPVSGKSEGVCPGAKANDSEEKQPLVEKDLKKEWMQYWLNQTRKQAKVQTILK